MEKSLVLVFFKSTYFWSSRLQMFFKVGVLKSYAIFTGKTTTWSHFWIKFQSFRPADLKVTQTKVLFCEYCKIFKNSFFHRTPLVALLPFSTTFQNYYWKDRLITVNKDHVLSTPEKHLKKVLGMLQVVKKETQSLPLTFSIFHILF